MSKNPFQATGDARVRRSALDLSHSQLMSQRFGQLVPLSPVEVLPGDVVDLSLSSFIRAMPMVRPPIGRTKLRTYHFFVNYRILFDEWEEFIGGQEDYDPDVPYVPVELPYLPATDTESVGRLCALGSLWDYFGWPVAAVATTVYAPATSYKAMTFPHEAYWRIWNEFFRVPGIQPKLIPDWTAGNTDPNYNWQYAPGFRNHTRDYFTALLPWTQRGTPPALGVFGSASVDFDLPVVDLTGASGPQNPVVKGAAGADPRIGFSDAGTATISANPANATANFNAALSAAATVDGSTFSSVDINDLRLAWQTQVFLERQARGGARYTEIIESHFGIRLFDNTIQRPQFIGGTVSDILFSEIPQTSATDGTQYQGNIAGHGVGSDSQRIGKFRVTEHGIILSLVCITVDAVYHQGFPRSFSRRLQLDFPWPEFTGLGEQEVFNYEVYANQGDGLDLDPMGFTGRYNELRYLPNVVAGLLRPGQNQAQWTQARSFGSRPTLSSAFISTASESGDDGAWMRPFAVVDPEITPPFVAHYARGLNILRPIPYLAEPSAIVGG